MSPARRHRQNINEPGHAHELTFSCYHQFRFLESKRTCLWLAQSINEARIKWNFDLWAYVFMPDHVHLIVHPRDQDYDIGQIRKSIKSTVATRAITYLKRNAPEWLPRITRQRGAKTERLFWQSGGGYDRNIVETESLMNMIDYIHLNPVRKDLVERAVDWKWSSASWYIDQRQGPIAIDPIPVDWIS